MPRTSNEAQPLRFTQDFLASLRERVPLSEIIGRVVTWDRRKSQPGKGDLWACCPFHEERTPSFHVDDRKGFYHCFGCQQSGDHLRFLTDHQGLDFPEAVKALAEAAGVALPDTPQVDDKRERQRRAGRDALDAAAALYTKTLWGPGGRAARDYAADRGLTEATLRAFGFGLSPSPQGFLTRNLSAEGLSEADLERAGLLAKTDGGGMRERFRGRLMVPIHDGRGRMAGFGGRTLENREPKYLNSPETPLFDKSALLYNAHRARGPAHRANRLFVVEGYLDAIALAQAGLEMVVASLGTSLTEQQIKLAWQLADEPVLCYDGDSAGRQAADRALSRIVPLLTAGKSFSILTLPEGQDPDDLIRAGGVEAFEQRAASAVPLVDALFAREAAIGANTPERMAALETRLRALAGEIADDRLTALYRNAFDERLYQLRRTALRGPRDNPAGQGGQGSAGKNGRFSPKGGRRGAPQNDMPAASTAPLSAPADVSNALMELERIVLGLFILRPTLLDMHGERLYGARFLSSVHQTFAAMLLEAYGATLCDESATLISALPERARMCLNEVWGDAGDGRGKRLINRFSILSSNPSDRFIGQCIDVFLLKLQMRGHEAELAAASDAVDDGNEAAESRLISLSMAIGEQRRILEDAERALTDEAAQLRRRAASGEDMTRPHDSLL
ncbi:DNA primase [Acuticoccus sp. MNP-M23]|uniref:DNA primase n=1 Tax=Acuticoccus sp. MNP-M23 TaxID=3072793 RepID=UPI0028166AA3|nr:DNA primase [Acuticoccus sp. MNP-M23]WMS40781.1 DNA primase [Acuticoccus sp. MNP-M23]